MMGVVVPQVGASERSEQMTIPNLLVSVQRRWLRIPFEMREVRRLPEVRDLDVRIRQCTAHRIDTLHDPSRQSLDCSCCDACCP
jgi:hypothetical protein